MDNLMLGYQAGVNLGGWISQYYKATKEHFDTFITQSDIEQIASWGMDHVRLPIDYTILEEDGHPFHYSEEGFSYIDRCIRWCTQNNLNIILDLHKTAGYAFSSLESNSLFESDVLQERFLAIWAAFAKRYKEHGKNVMFELLNEIVEPNSDRWNKLSSRAVQTIRAIDPNRVIIIGGNFYNSVSTLKELKYIEDDKLVYTFHFYEPHLFTHQKAGWEKAMQELDFSVHYPSGEEDYRKFLTMSDDFRKAYHFQERLDRDFLKECLQPALDFLRERKAELYCGEYGVIEEADKESRLRWHEDFVELLMEYGIGRAVWNYKLMNFKLVDRNSKVTDQELIRFVSKR